MMATNDREVDSSKKLIESLGNSNANLPKLICFDELARCGEEVWIVNRGDLYRLRRTKQGKLILTK